VVPKPESERIPSGELAGLNRLIIVMVYRDVEVHKAKSIMFPRVRERTALGASFQVVYK
jgi:hypothetical protein